MVNLTPKPILEKLKIYFQIEYTNANNPTFFCGENSSFYGDINRPVELTLFVS